MSRHIELTGAKFGKLTVLKKAGINKHRQTIWQCICDCGENTKTTTYYLRSGHTTSCGCVQKNMLGNNTRKHGMSGTKTYSVWQHMLRRCLDSKDKCYESYAARGITVCKRWLTFENFLADMGERPAGLSIDRKNNNGNYEPGNCRWATPKEQSRNTRTNRSVTYNGKTQCVSEWAEELGISMNTIKSRIKYKWPI